MRQQLTSMTIIELVRTANSYATSIKQTSVYSDLIKELSSRLEALNLAYIAAARQPSLADDDVLIRALTTIANVEVLNGDTVVCDFSTLVSVAAGALYQFYGTQIRNHPEPSPEAAAIARQFERVKGVHDGN
ncbi:hypothetical protein [Kosakonia sp. R1.Fl]|uniref:hypothetical protein n=1 Tax=Kosakonia sp. R1.Fl TaxID=2928706 RepID=UPI00201E6C83|nr:hypothetical protein [Kosakonia sp. R1.Fl]MCL6744402.1 hypothetical protein [Kosakonia sp. R1.Fl]